MEALLSSKIIDKTIISPVIWKRMVFVFHLQSLNMEVYVEGNADIQFSPLWVYYSILKSTFFYFIFEFSEQR